MEYEMKKINKIILVLLLLVYLTGCGRNEVSIGNITNNNQNVNDSTSYKSYVVSHDPFETKYSLAKMVGDKIYGYTITDTIPVIVIQEIETGKIIQKISLPVSALEVHVMDIAVDYQGEVYILASNYENFEDKNYLWKIDNAGELIDLQSPVFEDISEYTTLRNIEADNAGCMYFWIETPVNLSEICKDDEKLIEKYKEAIKDNVYCLVDRIYVKDMNMDTIFYIQIANLDGCKMEYFCIDKEGRPIVLHSNDGELVIQELDLDEKNLSQNKTLINGIVPENISMVTASAKGFMFSQDGVLYEYDQDLNKTEAILNWNSYGINHFNILCLETSDSTIDIIENLESSDFSEFTSLVEGYSDLSVLTLGGISLTQEMRNAVTNFNRYNKEIQIELVSYLDDTQSFEQALENLNLDIVTGKAPDIIETSMLDRSIYTDKDILTDLNDYLMNDLECSRDMMIDAIMDSSMVGGHIYSLSPSFQIYTIWGNETLIGNTVGVTVDELIELLEKKGKMLNAINGFSADEPVLTTLCSMCMDKFIDWENKECDFTGENFTNLLKFALEYTGGYQGESIIQGIKQEEILMTVGVISSMVDYQLQCKLYNGNLSFIGYPVTSGSGTAIGFRGEQLSINAASDSKDEAWEFIKFFVRNCYNGQGFPIMKEQFELAMEDAMEPFYEQVESETIEVAKSIYIDVDTYFTVFAATQKDVDEVKELIMTADTLFEYNTEILKLINEEAEAYLTGNKSLSDTTAIIQNRVQLYLNEKE